MRPELLLWRCAQRHWPLVDEVMTDNAAKPAPQSKPTARPPLHRNYARYRVTPTRALDPHGMAAQAKSARSWRSPLARAWACGGKPRAPTPIPGARSRGRAQRRRLRRRREPELERAAGARSLTGAQWRS
jgi:hypothetical protein